MLGIIASVKSNLSPPQLLYRYPPIVRPHISKETILSRRQSQKIKVTQEPDLQVEPYLLPGFILSSILLPTKNALEKSVIELEIDNTLFITKAIDINQAKIEKGESIIDSAEDRLVSLSVSIALNAQNLERHVIEEFHLFITHLASSLHHTETIDSYLSFEAKKILRIREQWLNEQLNSIGGKDKSPRKEGSRRTHAHLNEDILSISTFARELKDMYHSLLNTATVNITFNNWVSFSFVIQNSSEAFSSISIPLRPYHAILVLPEDPKVPGTLIPNNSNQLSKLLQLSHPTRSLQELQVELGIPLAQLYRMASHLIYWRKARIIDKISVQNIYRCDSSIVYQHLLHEFGGLFPSVSLVDSLKIFMSPCSVANAIKKTNQPHFMQVIIWLLQRNFLVQIHQFIYFLPKIESPEQYESIIESLNDGPSKSYLLLLRLIPYFDGKCTIREIMWRENIDRKAIDKVIEKFSSVLLCTQHESPHK